MSHTTIAALSIGLYLAGFVTCWIIRGPITNEFNKLHAKVDAALEALKK